MRSRHTYIYNTTMKVVTSVHGLRTIPKRAIRDGPRFSELSPLVLLTSAIKEKKNSALTVSYLLM